MTARAKRWGKGAIIGVILTVAVTAAIAVYGSVRVDVQTVREEVKDVDKRLQGNIATLHDEKADKVVVNDIKEQFDKFEERLWNRMDKTDEKIERMHIMLREHNVRNP